MGHDTKVRLRSHREADPNARSDECEDAAEAADKAHPAIPRGPVAIIFHDVHARLTRQGLYLHLLPRVRPLIRCAIDPGGRAVSCDTAPDSISRSVRVKDEAESITRLATMLSTRLHPRLLVLHDGVGVHTVTEEPLHAPLPVPEHPDDPHPRCGEYSPES